MVSCPRGGVAAWATLKIPVMMMMMMMIMMSTSQRAGMLCGWGVTAGMAYLQVKLCVAISEHLENALVFKDALQMSRFVLLKTFYFSLWPLWPVPLSLQWLLLLLSLMFC